MVKEETLAVVHLARLIHAARPVLGGPAVRAALGGNMSLPCLLVRVGAEGVPRC
jgi:hypothetical protein